MHHLPVFTDWGAIEFGVGQFFIRATASSTVEY